MIIMTTEGILLTIVECKLKGRRQLRSSTRYLKDQENDGNK
jgi:hypothetical protein